MELVVWDLATGIGEMDFNAIKARFALQQQI